MVAFSFLTFPLYITISKLTAPSRMLSLPPDFTCINAKTFYDACILIPGYCWYIWLFLVLDYHEIKLSLELGTHCVWNLPCPQICLCCLDVSQSVAPPAYSQGVCAPSGLLQRVPVNPQVCSGWASAGSTDPGLSHQATPPLYLCSTQSCLPGDPSWKVLG